MYYIVAGRFSEALESVAWYVLLILFILEITNQRLSRLTWGRTAMRGARLVATLTIGVTAALYVREKEWLDAANLFLAIRCAKRINKCCERMRRQQVDARCALASTAGIEVQAQCVGTLGLVKRRTHADGVAA